MPHQLYSMMFMILRRELNATSCSILYLRMTGNLIAGTAKLMLLVSVHGTETIFNHNYSPTETSQALL